MAPEKRISETKYWTDNQMRYSEWYEVKESDVPAFKSLIDERYGWPGFALNFSSDMKQVMKVSNA